MVRVVFLDSMKLMGHRPELVKSGAMGSIDGRNPTPTNDLLLLMGTDNTGHVGGSLFR